MDWTNETVMRFLKLYKKHPCIWDPRNASYRNRNRLNDAWIDIKNNLEEPCTVKELKKKRESLMSAYRGYRTKIKKSETSGTATSDVYQPTWFAYAFMDSFLGDIYKCNPSMSTENNLNRRVIADSNTDGQDDIGDTNTVGEQKSSSRRGSMIQKYLSSQQTSTATVSKRQHNLPELQQIKNQIDHAVNILKTVSQQHLYKEEDECCIFGKLIAKKMRKLPEDRKDLMMIKINQLFYDECYESKP